MLPYIQSNNGIRRQQGVPRKHHCAGEHRCGQILGQARFQAQSSYQQFPLRHPLPVRSPHLDDSLVLGLLCYVSRDQQRLPPPQRQARRCDGARTQACFRELRRRRAALEAADSSLPKLSTFPLRLVSENNFPTAAGLASSAAGFAALVRAVADLYELPDSPAELSLIARQGSGSACRSLFGGYVAWREGKAEDGSDSMADQVAEAAHWPDMRALVLVASAAKKGVSSTSGMQQTVATSGLFKERIATVVPQNMARMEKAIQERDFEAFAEVTMRDSNSFHATCADTYPPIFYMNDVSRAAVRAVEAINAKAGRTVAAYTFDAGPNAVVYYLEKDSEPVVGTFNHVLGEVEGWKKEVLAGLKPTMSLDEGVAALLKSGISRVIMTGVGEGPQKTEEHLL